MLRNILLAMVVSVLVSGCIISGNVQLDGEPVDGITVMLKGDSEKTVKTNSKGNFTFFNVKKGTYAISVEKCGLSQGEVAVEKESTYKDVTGLGITLETLVWEGDYLIWNKDDMEDIKGYSIITGSLKIFANGLEDLDGLECLQEIQGSLYIVETDVLKNLDGLINLETIGWNLVIGENEKLTTLDGLANVVSIENNFQIYYNDRLTKIQMASLGDVGNEFTVTENPQLCDNYAYHLKNAILSNGHIGGITYIYNNKACN